MPRTGKISRFPVAIREDLNQRLACNVPGRVLAKWLNSLPAVRKILRDTFDGKPINEQNISEWRQGGFQEWLRRQDLLSRLDDLSLLDDDIQKRGPSIADRAARLLSSHLALLISDALHPAHTPLKKRPKGPRNSIPPHQPASPSTSEPADSTIHDSRLNPSLNQLLSLSRALCSLRRGDHSAARLKMEQANHDRDHAPDDDSESPGERILIEGLRRLAYGIPRDTDPDDPPPPSDPSSPSRPSHPSPPRKSGKIRQNQTSNFSPSEPVPTHTHTLTPTPSEPAPRSPSEPPHSDSSIHDSPSSPSTSPPPSPPPMSAEEFNRLRHLNPDPMPEWREKILHPIPPWLTIPHYPPTPRPLKSIMPYRC
ncbi:MAG TPA: hypothetical protein VG796_20560 [Verrucomicrobiales bacterium]|nr:hypothetical protein [Verrucomicrobiales bacterium]